MRTLPAGVLGPDGLAVDALRGEALGWCNVNQYEWYEPWRNNDAVDDARGERCRRIPYLVIFLCAEFDKGSVHIPITDTTHLGRKA